MGRERTRVDHLDALPTFEGAGVSDLDHLGSGGEVHPRGAQAALTVRRTRRPWERSTEEMGGMLLQGRALRVRCRVFWLLLTVST